MLFKAGIDYSVNGARPTGSRKQEGIVLCKVVSRLFTELPYIVNFPHCLITYHTNASKSYLVV